MALVLGIHASHGPGNKTPAPKPRTRWYDRGSVQVDVFVSSAALPLALARRRYPIGRKASPLAFERWVHRGGRRSVVFERRCYVGRTVRGMDAEHERHGWLFCVSCQR